MNLLSKIGLYSQQELDSQIAKALDSDKKERNEKLIAVQKAAAQKTIKEAMVVDGVQYYEFDDINNLLSGRAFACMDYYKELSMRCTREYLTAHTEAIEELLTNGKQFHLGKLHVLNMQLKERLDMVIDPEIVYKIASVIYFDAKEEPFSYDYKYNHEKIKTWKKNGLDAFFLLKRLKDLIPLTNILEDDLKQYLSMASLINQEHFKSISTMLSNVKKMTEWYSTLKLQQTLVSEKAT